jgi:hypothetical protein
MEVELSKLSKNLSLNDVIAANENAQRNVAVQLKEIQEKLTEIKLSSQVPKIDPAVIQGIKNLSGAYIESAQTMAANIKKAFDMQINSISVSLPLISLRLQQAALSIDWKRIKEGLKARLEAYEQLMGKYDSELWAIDQDLFDILELDHIEPPLLEVIEKHVEEMLNSYLEKFKEEEMYQRYVCILEQSYAAFRSEQYALASFPLFAVVEGIMSEVFKEYEIDVEVKPKLRKKRNQLYIKLSDYVDSTEDELAISLLFFRRVFKVYEELFKPAWDKHPEKLNRNWMMHGSYHYEKITKRDVLKLFQLVKSTIILKDISFEEVG